MNNEQVRNILVQRTRLEDRIKKFGGKLPPRWPWDDWGDLRNLQLLQIVEALDRIDAPHDEDRWGIYVANATAKQPKQRDIDEHWAVKQFIAQVTL